LSVPPAVDHKAIAPFTDSLYRKASVTVQPARGSGLLGKIPLLRRLQKRPQVDAGVVSARPLRRVAPAVPPSLEATQDVDVRVRIDESGEVSGAEVLTKGAEEVLANAAEDDARDWRFEPAQRMNRIARSGTLSSRKFKKTIPMPLLPVWNAWVPWRVCP
jgi:hypothetical protein